MDNKTVFVVTLKGEGEIKNHTRQLQEDAKRFLLLIDDESSVEALSKRAPAILRAGLVEGLQKLESGGFIQDKAIARAGNMLRMVAPKTSGSIKENEKTSNGEDLDFTSNMNLPPSDNIAKAQVSSSRSMIATVLFFDVVGYTKQSVAKQIILKDQFNQLVSGLIEDIDENQRIILDTGDGAAIGFLQHPEDAIEVALKFRDTVTANKHADYPELKVRIGIHLGPVRIVKDMNGQSNMVGDGINDAQRIMSFASSDCIYISRSYYDVVSRLSTEYANLFQYCGTKDDKHGRQHQVYEAVVNKVNISDKAEFFQGDVVSGMQEEQQKILPESLNFEQFDPEAHYGKPATAAPAQLSTKDTDHPEKPNVFNLRLIAEQVDTQQGTADEKSTLSLQDDNEIAGYFPQEQQAVEMPTLSVSAQPEPDIAEKLTVAQQVNIEIPSSVENEEQLEREASLMAEEEAKRWADAAQRAKAQALVHTQAATAAHEPSHIPPASTDTAIPQSSSAPVVPPIQAKRPAQFVRHKLSKPMTKLQKIVLLFVMLLGVIVGLPYVWPMQHYAEQLEKKLSTQLQQSVHIATMNASWFPLPKLELQDVTVGDAHEFHAASITLNFDVKTLFSGTKRIKLLEVGDAALKAETVEDVLEWLQDAGGISQYPVTKIVLQGAHINGNSLNLPPINGEASWDASGHFNQALIRSQDGKIEVELQLLQSRWQISAKIKESSLPLLPGIVFADLHARGEIDESSADFSDIYGHLYGGRLTGSAHLDWLKDWQIQGRLGVKAMDVKIALPELGMEGRLDGDSSFQLRSIMLPQLVSSPHLSGTFNVKNGLINKIDIVETAIIQHASPGGRTRFDELSGELLLENNIQHYHQIRISSQTVGASGTVDVTSEGHLSGQLSVDTKIRPSSVPLKLSGTLAEPVLRYE